MDADWTSSCHDGRHGDLNLGQQYALAIFVSCKIYPDTPFTQPPPSIVLIFCLTFLKSIFIPFGVETSKNNFSWSTVCALNFDIGALILMAFGYWWPGSCPAERLLPMIGLLSMIGMPSVIGPCRILLLVHLISDTQGPSTGRKHHGCMARETDQLTWTKMINHQDANESVLLLWFNGGQVETFQNLPEKKVRG